MDKFRPVIHTWHLCRKSLWNSDSWSWIHIPQGRSQTSYTAPCNGVVSHGAQIGGLRVFANHTHRNKCKTNASTIFAHRAAFYTFYLHAQTTVDAGDIYAPDEPRLFWLREKPKDPKFENYARIKMAQVLGSPVYHTKTCVFSTLSDELEHFPFRLNATTEL